MNGGLPALIGWGLAVALTCSALTALAVRYASDRGLVDRPGPRRSHARDTPRGGGVAIIAAIALAALTLALWKPEARATVAIVVFAALALAALGFRDDHRPLPASLRLAVQFVVGAVVLWRLGGAGSLQIGGWELSGGWLNLLALVAWVWLINLFNFMDGINGIASVQAAFGATAFMLFSVHHGDAVGALLGAIVGGACLGFLPWNFPRARIFMGDSGSYGLGAVLGLLFLRGHLEGSFSVLLALICFAVFVIDASLTLIWRLLRRARWYTAHRDHAYQQLVRSGWSHGGVVGAVTIVNALVVGPLLWWAGGVEERQLSACLLALAP